MNATLLISILKWPWIFNFTLNFAKKQIKNSTKIEFMSNISDKQFLKPTYDKSKDCMFKKLKADIKNQNISSSVWFNMYIPGYINKFLQTQGFIQ